MQIILGTAQLSGNYGILNKNTQKKFNKSYLNKIYEVVKKNKINFLDTSENYPTVHRKIGCSKLNQLKIITKINVDKFFDKKKIEKKFNKILKDLQLDSIYGLLIHNPENLNRLNIIDILNFFKELKINKKVKKIGVSIYDKKDLNIIKQIWTPDIVQLPINILNRDLIKNKTIEYLKKKNVDIHVRSIFLQGLLLSPNLPKKVSNFKSTFIKWNLITNNKLEKKIFFSLKYFDKFYKLNKFVIGFDNIEQIQLLNKTIKKNKKLPLNLNKIVSNNKILKDPRQWNKL